MCSPSSHRLIPSLHSCCLILHFSLQFYSSPRQQLPSWILQSLSQQCLSVFPLPTFHAFSRWTFSQLRNNFLSRTEPRSRSCAPPNQALGLRELNSWAARLPWVILAAQGSFSCLTKLSADSQGRNHGWPFEHSVWSTSSQHRAPRDRLEPE